MSRSNRRRRPARDWTTVCVGIITLATIIAAATVAASINFSRPQPAPIADYGPIHPTVVAGSIALFSLWAYLFVVFTGLLALFIATADEQEPIARLAALAFYAQVFAVVIFASIIILGPLT